jgi:DNA-binding NtrC family response regulator
MKSVLVVLQLSDAFADVWTKAVAALDVEVRVVDSAAEAGAERDACLVIIAAGGLERAAAERIAEVRKACETGIAVVGAEQDYRVAVAVMRAGAEDYFAMPHDYARMSSWITDGVQRTQAGERARALAEQQRKQYDFSALIGRSAELHAALERASMIIPHTNATVLLTGETGTGKELLAQAIHYNGPRAAEPFIEINCSAIPAQLLEGELFGYERGAFTDARSAKAGLFEAANGGTFFLDEVAELSLELQAKLLKVLEERKVRRLGSVRDMALNIRVIAATHVDLGAAVRRGEFRQDLYYRLNVVPINLPALRTRGNDVILLAEKFLDTFSAEYGIVRPPLNAAMRRMIMKHPWPGNVRELRNAIERAVLLSPGSTLDPEYFDAGPATPSQADAGALPFPATLDSIEQAAARAMVAHCGGNKSDAARRLAISRTRLMRLLDGGAGDSTLDDETD